MRLPFRDRLSAKASKAAAPPGLVRALRKRGYSRDEFGQTWTDDVSVDGGHNGCGTMDDILLGTLVSSPYGGGLQSPRVMSTCRDRAALKPGSTRGDFN